MTSVSLVYFNKTEIMGYTEEEREGEGLMLRML